MFNVIFYFNHYNTLGHSTRILSFVKALKYFYKKKIRIIVLQSGKKQNLIPLSNFSKVYILPYSIDKRGFFIEENRRIYERMILSSKMKKMLEERLSIIRRIVNQYNPTCFITEYFPFGREFWSFEIPYILRYIKDNYKCKIVSSCGYLSWMEKTYDYIKEFYDLLLIHSPYVFSSDYHLYLHPQGVQEIDKVIKDFSDKLFFTGFILDTPENKTYKDKYINFFKKRNHQPFILVSRGGGIVNRKIILASLLVARKNKNWFFIICCGPATSSAEMNEYRNLIKNFKNVKLIKALPQYLFDYYLKKADLSINMAGYNTVVRLLYYNKKTITIPYHTSEQKWRASLVRRYLCSEVIDEEKLKTFLLEEKIKELLSKRNDYRKVEKKWFSGIATTLRILNRCIV